MIAFVPSVAFLGIVISIAALPNLSVVTVVSNWRGLFQ
jgi:hypothetical protein